MIDTLRQTNILARFDARSALAKEVVLVDNLRASRALLNNFAADYILPQLDTNTQTNTTPEGAVHEVLWPHLSLDNAHVMIRAVIAPGNRDRKDRRITRLKIGLFQGADRTQYFDFRRLTDETAAQVTAQNNFKPYALSDKTPNQFVPEIDTIQYDADPYNPKFSVRYLFGFGADRVFVTTGIGGRKSNGPTAIVPISDISAGLIVPGTVPNREDGLFTNNVVGAINTLDGFDHKLYLRNPEDGTMTYVVGVIDHGKGYDVAVSREIGDKLKGNPQLLGFSGYTNNEQLPAIAARNALALLAHTVS